MVLKDRLEADHIVLGIFCCHSGLLQGPSVTFCWAYNILQIEVTFIPSIPLAHPIGRETIVTTFSCVV